MSSIQISKQALVQRVNRKLSQEHKQLRAYRGKESGGFFVIDLDKHVVVFKKVDVEAFARKLGVLKEWELVEGTS
jgi:hypothetical protein